MKGNVKRLFLMAFAFMVLMPLNIYAIDLSNEDFAAAKEGDTSKGLHYDGDNQWFKMDSGEYTITENIDLEEDTLGAVDENVIILDLNGMSITSANTQYALFELYDNSKATIKGNGTMNCDLVFDVYDDGILTIENGTFNGDVDVYGYYDDGEEKYYVPTLTINDGTFNGKIYVEGEFYDEIIEDYYPVLNIKNASINGNIAVIQGKLVMDNGTVDATEVDTDAVYVWNGSSAIINGGTFKSPYNGLMVEPGYGEGASDIKSVIVNGGTFIGEDESGVAVLFTDKFEINGGSFTGGISGLYFSNVTDIKLKGGNFKFTGEVGAAIYTDGDSDELLTDILAEGYVYDPELEAIVESVEEYSYVGTQREISVINPSENDYKFLEGENAEYTIDVDEDLTFRINANYSFFENGGKVYVDDELVKSTNYTSLSGSTIINLKKDYVATLKEGEHTFKVVFNNSKEASTKFTIKAKDTTKNPQTSDNILMYVSIMLVSFMGLGSLIYKMRKEN